MKPEEIKQITNSLQNEINGAALYQGMAEAEKDPKIAEVYRRMAASEQRHADLLARRLESAGVAVPAVGITLASSRVLDTPQRLPRPLFAEQVYR
jgi:rubrerythrin